MDFSTGNYRLVLAREPFTLTLYRGDTPVLATHPHDEPVRAWQREAHAAVVTFDSGILRIEVMPGHIACRWHAPDVPSFPPSSGEFPNVPATFSAATAPHVAFALDVPWYGQGEFTHQLWPLNGLMFAESELLTTDMASRGLKGIQTPAWINAHGIAVLARGPVRAGINAPPEGYQAPAPAEPFMDRPPTDPGGTGSGLLALRSHDLQYEILMADDLPAAHAALVERLGHPEAMPPQELFTSPIWSTWARYRTEVNQQNVLRYAREIVERQYPYAVFEIDDRWQVRYGDLAFDTARFPDARGMVHELHALGFKVTAWVIPFLDPRSDAFAEGAQRGYLVRSAAGEPYLVRWWQGHGGLLDATNARACDWFAAQLHALQAATGLDGFKFDAGEAAFVPPDALLAEATGDRNVYSTRYVEFVARHFALAEVRAGWFNQAAPLFFRQWDKSSLWGLNNGLHSVITVLLTLSMTGYAFVLPDMIGGTAFEGVPDAELMVRWTQLNALLPAMQFSLAPWDYGEECVELCRRYARLHTQFAPEFVRAARECLRSGAPLARPVFWLAPRDERAWYCDDEFLMGDRWLVAPVVTAGARARDVYLPEGTWKDYWSAEMIEGGRVLKAYPAPLELLPLFERMHPDAT